MAVRRPIDPVARSFSDREPELASDINSVLNALEADLVPTAAQHRLFQAMSPSVRREIVAKAAGLDASVLVTFKSQLELVDRILRRTFRDDGSVSLGEDDLGMSPKDVMNAMFKVNQMLTRDLPKVITMDRVQKLEEALFEVMDNSMTKEQQDAVLMELEKRK